MVVLEDALERREVVVVIAVLKVQQHGHLQFAAQPVNGQRFGSVHRQLDFVLAKPARAGTLCLAYGIKRAWLQWINVEEGNQPVRVGLGRFQRNA